MIVGTSAFAMLDAMTLPDPIWLLKNLEFQSQSHSNRLSVLSTYSNSGPELAIRRWS